MHFRTRLVALLPFLVVPFACSSQPNGVSSTGSPNANLTTGASSSDGSVPTTTSGATNGSTGFTASVSSTSAGTQTVTSSSTTASTTGAGGQTVTGSSTTATTGFTSSVGTTSSTSGSGGAQTVTGSTSAGGATTGANVSSSSSGGNGGAGNTAGTTTTTGGGTVTASPGCGKSGPPNGGKVYVDGESWLLFPSSYDGNTPMPVLFGFHGCGSGNRGDASRTEYTDLTSGTAFETDYIRAIPISSDSGGCWNYNTDIVRVTKLYDDLVNNYCVDLSHVFATGHSSGAQFIVEILTGSHTADAQHLNFKAVAPVAASSYGPLAAPMPVMYIQNANDQVRGSDGKDVVDQFVAANMCSSTSTPYTPMGAGCQSSGVTVDPNCISYDNCSVPTIWCSHNDPQYSNTGHGVPCFAALAIDEFFKGLD